VATESWLTENAYIDVDGHCRHSDTNAIIRALMPMHTFGHPVMLDQLELVSKTWNLVLLEDAAESLGSLYRGRHTGTIGRFGALSFNGNKIITTGGGGMILCRDRTDGDRAKHVTTTAKVPHLYEFYHDESGFNYRLPNLNAALGCAQMEQLNKRLVYKRKLAKHYADFFDGSEFEFLEEPGYAQSNYWLNTVICQDFEARNDLLRETNEAGVMTRPVWQLMHRLPMFSSALRGSLVNSEWAEQRLVNLPSCVNGVIG
jgi:dTDP-4-amino-4,6-dideoxygalactose transaminase